MKKIMIGLMAFIVCSFMVMGSCVMANSFKSADEVEIPYDTITEYVTDAFSVFIPCGYTVVEDSLKELRGSKSFKASFGDYKLGFVYIPLGLDSDAMLEICPEREIVEMSCVGEVYDSVVYKRHCRTQKMEDMYNNTATVSCWSNGEYTVLFWEKRRKDSKEIKDNKIAFVWTGAGRSNLSAAEKLAKFNEQMRSAFENEDMKMSLSIDGNIVNIRTDNHPGLSGDNYHQVCKEHVSRMVKTITAFKELAEERYKFRYLIYGKDGNLLVDYIYSADELIEDIEL